MHKIPPNGTVGRVRPPPIDERAPSGTISKGIRLLTGSKRRKKSVGTPDIEIDPEEYLKWQIAQVEHMELYEIEKELRERGVDSTWYPAENERWLEKGEKLEAETRQLKERYTKELEDTFLLEHKNGEK